VSYKNFLLVSELFPIPAEKRYIFRAKRRKKKGHFLYLNVLTALIGDDKILQCVVF